MENIPTGHPQHPALLSISELSFAFGKKAVLQQLSLNVLSKSIHGILGDNGAGKTTLFNVIFGNLTPTSGHMHFHPAEIATGGIAYLETEPFFYAYMTGREYLQLVSFYQPADLEKWNQVFDLPLNDYVHTYSTGMKKKLAFLGVVMLDKPLIILDEPFNGLDMAACEVVNYILQKLKANGKTILLSSHILSTLLANCDRISMLHAGTMIRHDEKAQFNVLESFLQARFRENTGKKIDELM
jgi:ABC-2 type transport system ATP-binding protein